MIIRIARRGFGKYVVLNKKQIAMRCAPRKYEIKEAYIQRIVRAIDAVQIYILTTFFKKTTIRIFPIALPSKVDNVERVFNGYKKKYVDKVLREFIMI